MMHFLPTTGGFSFKTKGLLVSLLFIIGMNLFAQESRPIDKNASAETVKLWLGLKATISKGIMFGHQDDLAYGVGWKYQDGNSDIKAVTGDYPAVYGWELGRIELDHVVNLDSVPFDKMREFIKIVYERGGVNTISWHLNNPLTGLSAWNPEPGTVAAVLPGGSKNELYKSWLDRIAVFMQSLKGDHGESIPIIFRIFHELNGNWFWWGGKNCTPDELKQLWRFTVSYLRDEKKVHNLLFAYNTDRFATREAYLEKYPGDEWVDIIGFDIYQRGDSNSNKTFIHETDTSLTILESIAREKNKIPALTEFGYNELPYAQWWTGVFWPAIRTHKISYVMAWRNAGYKSPKETEFYVPYKGQSSAADFAQFAADPGIIFQKKMTTYSIYK